MGFQSRRPFWLMVVLEGADSDGGVIELGYGGNETVWNEFFDNHLMGMAQMSIGQLIGGAYPVNPGVWVWEGDLVAVNGGLDIGNIPGTWRRATKEEVGDWLEWTERQTQDVPRSHPPSSHVQ